MMECKTEVETDIMEAVGEFFVYVSNVARAIRMNSAYNKDSQYNPYAALDVMWLSDALHNLGMLGKVLQGHGNIYSNVDDMIKPLQGTDEFQSNIDRLIDTYRDYISSTVGYQTIAMDTFDRHKDFDIHPERAIELLQKIKTARAGVLRQKVAPALESLI